MTGDTKAARAEAFGNSIGINVHMDYTNGAYANVTNVINDLAYLGITNVRDGLPADPTTIPVFNQITADEEMAKKGIKFDYVTGDFNVAQDLAALNKMEKADPGSITAAEGPNEINNWPVDYDGLTGWAAATAFQTAYYAAVHADSALNAVSIFDFTGAPAPILTTSGTLTKNASGDFTLAKGIAGWVAYLPVGETRFTIHYSGGTPFAGLYTTSPGNGQIKTASGANGVITFTYENTGTSRLEVYVSVADWTGSTTITSISALSGNSNNLVTFDPNVTGAGMSNYLNYHPYPSTGEQPARYIAGSLQRQYVNQPSAPAVITEDGYQTDSASAAGVTLLQQAQGDLKILLDAFRDGVSRTYLYELMNNELDPTNAHSEDHFGVFGTDNVIKPAALAIHDLTAILKDTGPDASSFTLGALNDTVRNLPSTAYTLLLEKSNGTFDLIVWNEPTKPDAGSTSVIVDLGGDFQNVAIYDPVKGSSPIKTQTNISWVTLNLGNDPLIVQVSANKVAGAAKAETAELAATRTTVSAAKVSPVTVAQIAGASTLEIAAPSTRQMKAILPLQLAEFSHARIAAISLPDIALLSASQAKALSAGQIDSFTLDPVKNFTPGALHGLTASQAHDFTRAQLAAMRTSQHQAFA